MWEKGESGNPKGRPKGARDKAKGRLVERITDIVECNIDKLQSDIDTLEPQERIKAITSLINYVLPKQAAVDVQAAVDAEYKALERLIDEAPDEFVDKITEKILTIQEEKQNERQQK